MTVSVEPNSEQNTHNIKLSDGVTDIGLILCDATGKYNQYAFRRTPIPRSALKMYSGEQRHSDLEPPWQDVAMTDFSGGRGSEKYETDTTKYWDGRQIDTSRGAVILAPMETFDKGQAVVANNTYWPTHSETTYARKKYTQYSMYSTTSYIAIPFTGTSSYSVKTAYIWAKKIGTGTRTMMAHIVADSAGSPADAVAADKSDSYTFTGNR